MYEKDGIIYVEGIEEVFMGYFLTYHKDRYRFVISKGKATEESRLMVCAAEQARKEQLAEKARQLKEEENRRKAEAKKAEEQKPKKLRKADMTPEQWREHRRAMYRNYYKKDREKILQRQRDRWKRKMTAIHGEGYEVKRYRKIPEGMTQSEYNSRYYRKHRAKAIAKSRAYYREHHDEILRKQREKYHKKKEQCGK